MPLSIRLKEEQMERLEDLAKQRSETVKAGKSKTYTLNEVLERNGLSD